MTAATKLKDRPAQAPVKARDLMEQLNADAGKHNIWVRTELNAPAQRAWFTDTGGKTGAGQLAAGGRVAANQIKTLPASWRWKDYRPFLDRINDIATRADVSPIEFAGDMVDGDIARRAACARAGGQHLPACIRDEVCAEEARRDPVVAHA